MSSMHAPLIQLFNAAEYAVCQSELERWFPSNGFTTLPAKKMEDIATCFSALARLRSIPPAASPVVA